MSTKIYNAYRFNGYMPELIKILKEIRTKYQEEQVDVLVKFKDYEFKKDYFKFLEKDYTMTELSNEPLGDLFLADILEKEMSFCHNTPLNILSSSVIYFHNDEIYIQFFGLKEKYIKEYRDKLIDFHYQNQTDMSNYNWETEDWEKMTDERRKELEDEWNVRKNVWDSVIDDIGTFSECGLTFDFNPSGYKLTQFCSMVLQKIKNN